METEQPYEPYLTENHPEETNEVAMDENNFQGFIENCLTTELHQSIPPTPTYGEHSHDESEISRENLEIMQTVEEDSIYSERVNVEADLGFFELLSDSDNDEDYLEFQVKAAVYYKTPVQSEDKIFTAKKISQHSEVVTCPYVRIQ